MASSTARKARAVSRKATRAPDQGNGRISSPEARKIVHDVNEALAGIKQVMDHNSGVYQGAFFRQDIVGSALLSVLSDITDSLVLVAKQQGVEVTVALTPEGQLNQAKYFDEAHATVMAQLKEQDEARARGMVPAQQPLIERPEDHEVLEFGGNYEDDGTKDREARSVAE